MSAEMYSAALDTVRSDSDAGDNLTCREYLRELLLTLWHEGEGFSGKRPFGNGGWEYDLFVPLARGKFIKATLTPWGEEPDEVDIGMTPEQRKAAHKFVAGMIRAAFSPEATP